MTRVLLVEMSGIVAELVRQIVAHHDDVEIVASVSDPGDVESHPDLAAVDLVITALAPGASHPERLERVLAARPGLRVLAVEDDGRCASLYTLAPQRMPLGPLSPENLIAFIRATGPTPPRAGSVA